MARRNKSKGVKVKVEPSIRKQPKVASGPSSFNDRKAAWRISHLEMEAPYGWQEVDLKTFAFIRSKLAAFESMTWNQIIVEGKKHHHSIPVDEIVKSARERLEAINQDDTDVLVSLRLSAKSRVWGILEEGVLRLLWWDPNHEICPSKKKNT